jgi:4-hydroxy-3-methylbut-2-enyl diphosphate reductase IspH
VEDICYATTNRQEAVKTAARQVDAVIVAGAANSSNSQRLCEVAEREGCAAQLVADARNIDWGALRSARSVAVAAGASAPDILVDRILEALGALRDCARDAEDRKRVDDLPSAARAARSGAGARLKARGPASCPNGLRWKRR